MSTVADITTGGGAIDPMKPVNGATDSQLDFDDPAQVSASAAKAANTPRGKKANAKSSAEKSGKAAPPKESRTEEEARPQNNGRRKPQRHVPSPRRAAGRRAEAAQLADPDEGESADDAYQRVADRMEGSRGRREQESRTESRRERSTDRDETRREREDRNSDRNRRRANKEPVGGFDRLREREEGNRSVRDDDGDDRRSRRRPIHDEDDIEDTRRSSREDDFDYEDDLEDDRREPARRRRDEEDRFEDERRPESRRRRDDDRDSRRDDRDRRDDLDDDEDGIPESLLREAVEDYGLDEDDILEEFEDADALERHLVKLDRKAAKAGRLPPPSDDEDDETGEETPAKKPGQAQGRSADGAPAGKQGKGQVPAAKTGADEGEPLVKKFEFKFDEDPELQAAYESFNEPTKTVLSKMTSHLESEVERHATESKQLQAKVDWMMQRHQEQAFQRFSESMDSFFDEIAPDYGDIFGEGPLEELDPESNEAKNRIDFQKELSALARGHKKNGLSDKELKAFQRKTLRLFGPTFEKLESNIRRKTIGKLEKRRRMSVARPSNRTRRRELTGEDAAAARLDRAYSEAGYAIDPVGNFDGEV